MLTDDLLKRLLASPLVPREAKLAAIESWRRELASASLRGPLHDRLERRLAQASRLLASSRQAAEALTA
jgi:hypothetical protein